MSKKIFITGCAKSGTTLLLRMCFAFEGTEILYKKGAEGHELGFEDFLEYESDQDFVIGKRHPPALLSTTYHKSAQYQAAKVLKNNIGIINVVRDGRAIASKSSTPHPCVERPSFEPSYSPRFFRRPVRYMH